MTASLCILASAAATSAWADTVGITYSLNGLAETAPPAVVGTTLFLDSVATGGSILSGNPRLDAAWNPFTFQDTCQADLLTGILTGVFTMTFANSEVLSGKIVEDVSAVLATFTGPYTGTLTFTGGTGEFAGATGSASISCVVGTTTSTAFGRGTVSAAGISAVPEPASFALMFEGLIALVAGRKLVRH